MFGIVQGLSFTPEKQMTEGIPYCNYKQILVHSGHFVWQKPGVTLDAWHEVLVITSELVCKDWKHTFHAYEWRVNIVIFVFFCLCCVHLFSVLSFIGLSVYTVYIWSVHLSCTTAFLSWNVNRDSLFYLFFIFFFNFLSIYSATVVFPPLH